MVVGEVIILVPLIVALTLVLIRYAKVSEHEVKSSIPGAHAPTSSEVIPSPDEMEDEEEHGPMGSFQLLSP